MNRTARKLNDFLATVASYDYVEEPIPKTVCAQAAGLMVELAPKPKRRKVLDLPGRTKEQRREEHREATAKLRTELLLLTEGYCERCGVRSSPAEGHMHHTRGGSGRRRAEQSIETVAWLCPRCHRALHADSVELERFRDLIAEKRAEEQFAGELASPEARRAREKEGQG